MKKVIFFAVVLCSFAGAAVTWSDNFDGYADQSAFEAGAWKPVQKDSWHGNAGPCSYTSLVSIFDHTSGSGKSIAASQPYQQVYSAFGNAPYTVTIAALGTGQVASVEVWFYDPLTSNASDIRGVARIMRGGGYGLVGVVGAISTNSYVYRAADAGEYDTGYINTGVSRSPGWHQIVFIVGDQGAGKSGGMYIDGILVGYNEVMRKGIWQVELGNVWNLTSPETFYFDDVKLHNTALSFAPFSFSDNFDGYASQTALEAAWPKTPSDSWHGGIGGSTAVEMSTEQSLSASNSVKSQLAYQWSQHYTNQVSSGSVELWFYDPVTVTAGNVYGMAQVMRGGGYGLLGVVGAISGTNYCWRGGELGNYDTGYIDTGIARTPGWHQMIFNFGDIGAALSGSMYLDGQLVGYNPVMSKGIWQVEIGNKWSVNSLEAFYFDNVNITAAQKFPAAASAPYSDTGDYHTYGLWHFDEYIGVRTPDDDSMSPMRDNDLYKAGNPILEASFDTAMGNCMYFNNLTTDHFVLNDPNKTGIDDLGLQTNNFRLEAWAKLADNRNFGAPGAAEHFPIISQDKRFYLHLADVGQWIVVFGVYDESGNRSVLNHYLSSGFDVAQWHHYAAVFYNGLLHLYIDGQLATNMAVSFTDTASTPINHFMIGRNVNNATSFWGWIDEVRLSQAVYASPECGYWGYLPGDVNKDCYVNIADLMEMSSQWLDVTLPEN